MHGRTLGAQYKELSCSSAHGSEDSGVNVHGHGISAPGPSKFQSWFYTWFPVYGEQGTQGEGTVAPHQSCPTPIGPASVSLQMLGSDFQRLEV